ncbi:hypothetical protein C8F01DRAFT_1136633, partial [Mycena amicta]
MRFPRLTSLFTFSFFDPDKFMVRHQSLHLSRELEIAGVIENVEIHDYLVSWERKLFTTHGLLQTRLQDLEGCEVTRIVHYRGPGRLAAHECVLVHIRAGDDTRVVRLERFRDIDIKKGTFRDDSSNKTRVTSGKDTGNDDHVIIGDESYAANSLESHRYTVVRSIDVPPSTVHIIHIVAIAMALSDIAKDYSLFHHMCMWWAANFTVVACQLANISPTNISQGPAHGNAGKIGNVPFVNPDSGKLVFAINETATLEKFLNAFKLRTKRKPELAIALKEDLDKLRQGEDGLLTSTEQIVVLANRVVEEKRGKLQRAVAELVEANLREAKLAADLDASRLREAKLVADLDESRKALEASLWELEKAGLATVQGAGLSPAS